MEDVDEPRSVPGAADDILRTLAAFAFTWDEPVVYQSQRTSIYRDALEHLRQTGWAYPCSCSRKDSGPGIYPGTCRFGRSDPLKPAAWRVRVDDIAISFDDRVYGRFTQNLAHDVGDFVALRSDGYFAYQLAVVADDAAQQITDVVRGADLLDSTPRQMWLQHLLGYPQPRYLHIPVVMNAKGEKLSKQTLAPPVNPAQASSQLAAALRFLGQDPAPGTAPREILESAVRRWEPGRIGR